MIGKWLPILVMAGLAAGRSEDAPRAVRLDKERQILQALNRLTFGPQPGDVERVGKMGLKKWIDQQLHPEKMGENPELEEKLGTLETLAMTPEEAIERYPPPFLIKQYADGTAPLPGDAEERTLVEGLIRRYRESKDQKEEARQAAKLVAVTPEERRKTMRSTAPQQAVTYDLWEGKLYRAIYSDRQLAEVLDDFWFNHFNVFVDKGVDRYLIGQYEREAIRPHLLGKFRDLLEATAKSPAMLFYLDNWQSVGTYSAAGERARLNGKTRGLNENYGRELLELHTLGVNGGYAQRDVIDVARCFSGWTIRAPRMGGGFFYNDRMHDKNAKTVLGHRIKAGGGMNDGEEVLEILARQPATARHISYEMAQRFVADEPPPALVERMAKTFLDKDGDLREVMKTMLEAPEFWSEGAYLAKMKTPFEMAVSAVRALDADVSDAFALSNRVAGLGEPLYRKAEPTGYSNAGADWTNSAALLARMNFALALARGKVPGIGVDTTRLAVDDNDPDKMAEALMLRAPGAQTRAAIEKALADQTAAAPAERRQYLAGLVLGSPDFQKK